MTALPYAGSSGWSGSATSRARAEHADSIGLTSERQRFTVEMLETAGFDGLTWREVAEATGEHHGSVSGVLSNLHKAGLIARLTATRERCAIYVALGYVWGRETAEPKQKALKREVNTVLDQLLERVNDIATARAGAGFLPFDIDLATLGAIVESLRD